MKIAFRVKPETSILISDCTQFAGFAPGIYTSHIGGKVLLSSEGRLSMADQPKLLAGSAQSLLWCVSQAIKKDLLSLKDAWNKASLKPLELLTGKPQMAFKVGEPANLVLFEQDHSEIKIIKTMTAGKILFSDSKK